MAKFYFCKKYVNLLIFIQFLLISTLVISANSVYAQSDFIMFLGTTINDNEIDGIIGQEWSDVTSYSNIEINPNGNAQVWIKHDQTHFYIAIQFQADSNNPWVAFQLDNTECMTSNTDGALFGNDNQAPEDYIDISFGGIGVISSDSSQDGIGAIEISTSNVITVELKKDINSGDLSGNDIQWSENNTYSLVIMWDSDGSGSSGGNANHRASALIGRTVFFNPEIIPEFSGLIPIFMIILLSFPLIFRKRIKSISKK
jgi:hypothetical protein